MPTQSRSIWNSAFPLSLKTCYNNGKYEKDGKVRVAGKNSN
jgi:hypothetical protein